MSATTPNRHAGPGGVLLCSLLALPGIAWAQDAPLPPRILDDLDVPPDADAPREGPGAARLAPPAEDREDVLEEIVVVGESEWRLPDLGSSWRAEQAAEQDPGRLDATFLPLYDPERAGEPIDLLTRNREMQRVGFIELFRIRFGGRSAD